MYPQGDILCIPKEIYYWYNYVSTLGNGYILWKLLNFRWEWVSPIYAEIQKGGVGVGISQKHNIAGIATHVGGKGITRDKMQRDIIA